MKYFSDFSLKYLFEPKRSKIRNDYYDSINMINDYPTLRGIYNELYANRLTDKITSRNIIPYDFSINQTRFQEAKKVLNKHQYEYHLKLKDKKTTSAFWKFKQGDLKIKSQIHFYDDKLILIKTDIVSHHNNVAMAEFWDKLKTKYDQEQTNQERIIFRDNLNNMILMENNWFAISIYYMRPDEAITTRFINSLAPFRREPIKQPSLDYAV
ncbi:MAG: hypothetical protein JXR34_07745 [Bacteroidales bacterium]|nr:hypothetical protein [Bacteroidales bacterium]